MLLEKKEYANRKSFREKDKSSFGLEHPGGNCVSSLDCGSGKIIRFLFRECVSRTQEETPFSFQTVSWDL